MLNAYTDVIYVRYVYYVMQEIIKLDSLKLFPRNGFRDLYKSTCFRKYNYLYILLKYNVIIRLIA